MNHSKIQNTELINKTPVADNLSILKTQNTMSTHENIDNQAPETKLESGKVTRQLTNELETETIKVDKEHKKRTVALPDDKFDLRRFLLTGYYLINERPGMSNFLQVVDEAINSISEGDFSTDKANDILEITQKLFSDNVDFCQEKGITFPGTTTHTLLSRVIILMVCYLDWKESDESEDFDCFLQESLIIKRLRDSNLTK